MFKKTITIVFCLIVTAHLAFGDDDKRKATAFLLGSLNNVEVRGRIVFAETDDGLHVSGNITGMPPGRYGFHIHEAGDISDCDLTLGHFDTANMVHGGQHHEIRHVGDLGNVIFNANREGNVDFVDPLMTLRGYNNILGRALVLHELEDDLGKVGDEGSLLTGNAGPRVACGVVGILEPLAPWNSAASLVPSFVILITALVSFLFNL